METKRQFIFFVPPNEELEGTLLPKNEGKRVHVPPDEKTCGHTAYIYIPKQQKLIIFIQNYNSATSF
jgi:hypothetical protein